MFNLSKDQKENYALIKNQKKYSLIENIIPRELEHDFSVNPLNALIIAIFSLIGFFLYFYYIGMDLDIKLFIIFLLFPIFSALAIFIGKWEGIIKIFSIGILGFYWWIGLNSLYFTIPVAIGLIISSMFQIVKEWDRAVLLRLGKFKKLKGPGFFIILPFIDSIIKIVDLRIRSSDFQAEKSLTKDSVAVTVDAVAFWMVWDAEKAILEVENFVDAVILSAQTALRDSVGAHNLSNIISKREDLGKAIREIVDKKTSEWGITIQSIEIKEIFIPEALEDILSKKAQAEREKELRVMMGDAEIELANKFNEASKIYQKNETALKLRSMNILFEGLKAGNSMMMVPSSILDNTNVGNMFGIEAMGELRKAQNKKKKE